MGVHIDAAGLTDVGKVRKNNEDQYLVARLNKSVDVVDTSLETDVQTALSRGSNAYLFVVADGVGGHAGGEIASETAIGTLVEHIERTVGCFYTYSVDLEHEFLRKLEDAVEEAHKTIVDAYGAGQGGPATTLTMVALVWPRAYIIHVGDSRAYHLQASRFRQLTRDQTMAELMVDEGVMTEEQAAGSRLEHVLSSAVGASTIKPSVGLIDLAPGDGLVLCSDGLTKHVSDEQIAAVAREGTSAQAVCRGLVDAALGDGGSDNVTVVVVKTGSDQA